MDKLHISIEVKEDDPPPFAPYQAEFAEASNGDIISHDHHLNEDGEALYQFLLTHSSKSPTYIVSISGTHTEHRTRTVYRTVNGQQQGRIENYTVTITDFAFSIDLAEYIAVGPLHVTHGDGEACYRGLMVRQVQTPTGRRKATKEEVEAFKTDKSARIDSGIPPWLQLDGSRQYANPLASSMSVRQWADEYAGSPKWLKEFVYEKRVYGWNQGKLQRAIETVVKNTGYGGSVHIGFDLSANKIRIRPDNRLSRTLSSTFWKVILIIFLVYPFIWLFKRFSSRGGGRWEIAAGMFALCQKEPVEPGGLSEGIAVGDGSLTLETRLLETEEGLAKVRGYREGEWFREWETVIQRCVQSRLRLGEPMRHPRDGVELDGY